MKRKTLSREFVWAMWMRLDEDKRTLANLTDTICDIMQKNISRQSIFYYLKQNPDYENMKGRKI
jgi:hypothetical protein